MRVYACHTCKFHVPSSRAVGWRYRTVLSYTADAGSTRTDVWFCSEICERRHARHHVVERGVRDDRPAG